MCTMDVASVIVLQSHRLRSERELKSTRKGWQLRRWMQDMHTKGCRLLDSRLISDLKKRNVSEKWQVIA